MQFQKQCNNAYVCVYCSVKTSYRRSFSATARCANATPASQQSLDPSAFVDQYIHSNRASRPDVSSNAITSEGASRFPPSNTKGKKHVVTPSLKSEKVEKAPTGRRLLGTQLESIAALKNITKKLSQSSQPTASIEDAIRQFLGKRTVSKEKAVATTLSSAYRGRSLGDVLEDISIMQHLNRRKPVDGDTADLIARLTRSGLLKAPVNSLWHRALPQEKPDPALMRKVTSTNGTEGTPSPTRKGRGVRDHDSAAKRKVAKGRLKDGTLDREAEASKDPDHASLQILGSLEYNASVDADALVISALARTGPAVPNLSHDLSRVLFNPGIYQLQDPRSRVYNFDPYLERIMPVSEFDFKILKEYITSSRDDNLRSLALEHGKKYIGSSSSMTSTLSQFHFLLSHWRELNTGSLSRGFADTLTSFTAIHRSPSAVFLRYQDGVYAMDADKEFDSANILMSLGRSMEKLLTQKPQEYERYRKGSEDKVTEEERTTPEAYQYTHAGDFLMRAQLDAHDQRLPGTGTFDLKTRAVAAIRHNLKQHEEGYGYQIKTRFGDWESYEREYFDMMRSAFLKYSLQVRLGKMDGIFVAFHNVERIFGFQYISLPEMDLALHGQYDTALGDQEFKLSVELLNKVLDRATQKFPKRSLRLQVETRDKLVGGVVMQIFAEPMDDSDIDAIQTSRKTAIDEFEQRLMNPQPNAETRATDEVENLYHQHKVRIAEDGSSKKSSGSLAPSAKVDGPSSPDSEFAVTQSPASHGGHASNGERGAEDDQSHSDEAAVGREAAGVDKAVNDGNSVKELLALSLRIRNRVNGSILKRPEGITSSDKWSLDYSLEEETNEVRARAQYRASKARRKSALDLEGREEDAAANYYLRRLRELAANGAEWRKAQDELDAGRQRVVLYQDQAGI
jgi:Mitochondrial protein Pet127